MAFAACRASRIGFILWTGLFPAPLAAFEAPGNESTLIVYGEDPCPQPQNEEEIVVCARRPEEERYRIPAPLRRHSGRPPELSWNARARELEESQRFTRPNSCSVVGTDGQTGCTAAMLRQWFEERRAAAAASASVP